MALASLVLAVGAAVQGSVGFGLALIAAPLLLIIDRNLVPGPMLAASLVLTLLVAWRDRRSMDTRGIGWALMGRALGTVPAVLALAAVSARSFDLFFGALVMLAVALSLAHPDLRPTRGTIFTAGAVSGFMGTISSIGGPPVALVYQHEAGARLRGTLAGYFVIGCIMSIAALAGAGLFGREEWVLSAQLVPGILVGFAVSRWTLHWVDRGATRPLVLILSSASAAFVLVRALL
jgi:uncharacterized membrane protein YfcA